MTRCSGANGRSSVEVISWAAGNGDRSENGDYIYGRKRLREIDRGLSLLARRMKAARVVDPAQQPDKSRIWFGATAELADDGEQAHTSRWSATTKPKPAKAGSAGTAPSPARFAAPRSAICDGAVARRRQGMGSDGGQLSRLIRAR